MLLKFYAIFLCFMWPFCVLLILCFMWTFCISFWTCFGSYEFFLCSCKHLGFIWTFYVSCEDFVFHVKILCLCKNAVFPKLHVKILYFWNFMWTFGRSKKVGRGREGSWKDFTKWWIICKSLKTLSKNFPLNASTYKSNIWNGGRNKIIRDECTTQTSRR